MQAWLEHDHGAGRKLSNVPKASPCARKRGSAQTPHAIELDRIRSSADYAKGDPLSVAKSRMLKIVIAGKRQAPSTPQPNRGIVYKTDPRGGSDPSFPTQGTQAAAALRAELSKLSKDLVDSRGELSRNPKKRQATLARRQEINAKLGGA